MTAPSDDRRQQLLDLLRARSVERGRFTLSSGRTSPYYVDARRTTMSAAGLDLVGALGLRAIRDAGWAPALVGGLTLGADPVAYAIALASRTDPPTVDAFTVRKQPKRHGTGQRIEGPFHTGAPVAIVEDVLTTGASALTAAAAVSEAGGKIRGVFVLVDRQEGGRERLAAQGYPVITLFTLDELAGDR